MAASCASSSLANHVLLAASNQENDLLVLDALSGAQLYCFKNCRATRNGVVVVPRTNHLVALQANKLALHGWSFGKDVPVWKAHLAEKMGPMTVTSCGNFVFAGGQSGKMYLWQVTSGDLLLVWDAHYKAISAVALTSDDSHLITAGEDAVVNVWRLADLLDEDGAMNACGLSFGAGGAHGGLTPVMTWTDHVLPVTSIHVGHGGVNAHIYTTSLDRTCKIWSLWSRQCLLSVTCACSLQVCVADPLETRLFLGADDGKIYVLDLHAAATKQTAAYARVVRLGASDHELTAMESNNSSRVTNHLPSFDGHDASVTSLQVSLDGEVLVSGDVHGSVRVWESASRQTLRSTRCFKNAITSLLLTEKPATLFQPSRSANSGSSQFSDLLLPVTPFKKYMTTSS